MLSHLCVRTWDFADLPCHPMLDISVPGILTSVCQRYAVHRRSRADSRRTTQKTRECVQTWIMLSNSTSYSTLSTPSGGSGRRAAVSFERAVLAGQLT